MYKCNQEMMLKHLQLVVDDGDQATIQVFSSKNSKSRIPQKVMHVDVSEKGVQKLAQLCEEGASVSVVPQKMDGNGRKKENVVGTRYLVVDLDEPTEVETIKELKTKPSLIVRTSPKRYHLYFKVKCKVNVFAKNSKGINEALGGDAQVSDVSHAFRLAGTINWKYDEPVVAKLVRAKVGESHKLQSLRDAFGVVRSDKKSAVDPLPHRHLGGDALENKIKESLSVIAPDDRTVWLHIGMALHSWSSVAGRNLWDEWSNKSDKFDRNDQDRTWNGFSSKAGRTVATIFYYANRATGKGARTLSLPIEDDEIAEYAAELLRDQIRIDDADKYYVFGPHHWREDSKAAVRLMMDVVKELKETAEQDGSESAKRRLKQQAGFTAAQKLFKGLHGFSHLDVRKEDFDQNPMLLGVKNGVVDLSTGEFRTGKASDMIQATTNVEFDPNAKCPKFRDFLVSIMLTKQYRKYFRQVCGYLLSGVSSEQVAFIMLGRGSNGKGTLTRLTEAILGPSYCTTVSPTFMKNATRGSANGPTPALMALRKARLIWCTETEHIGGVDKVFFKQLTGNDTLTGRHNYGEQESFRPPGKLVLTTNVMPDWPYDDKALWRRVKVLPFEKIFSSANGRNNSLDDTLAMEGAGVLNWMLAGARDYFNEGFQEPDEVKTATEKARQESDSVNLWLRNECRRVDGRHLGAKEAHDAYVAFAKLRRIAPASMKTFRQSMGRLGIVCKRVDKGNRYLDITLLSQ